MSQRLSRIVRTAATIAVAAATLVAVCAPAASAKPILMPTVQREVQQQRQIWQQHVFAPAGSLQPPAPPCPENGMLPEPFSNCGLPEFAGHDAALPDQHGLLGRPRPGHAARSTSSTWGWGETGAFPASQPCKSETLVEGAVKAATLKCDPDGAGKRMADFVSQMGGTAVGRCQTAVLPAVGRQDQQYIANPSNALAGIWVDDGNSATGLPKTSSSNPPGPGNTYTDLAAEAARAAAHFHVTDLADANFVIAQPAKLHRPQRAGIRLLRLPRLHLARPGGRHLQRHHQAGIAYTNMPYALAINSESSGGIRQRTAAKTPSTAAPPASSTASRSCSATRSRRRSPIPAPRTSSAAAKRQHQPRRLVRRARRQRERRQVRLGRRAARGRLPGAPDGAADPGRDGRHQGQPRHDLRGPVAVEQRSGRRHRLLRRRRRRPAAAIVVAKAYPM